MGTICPDHGRFDALYFKDDKLYRTISGLVRQKDMCRELRCASNVPCMDHLSRTYNIMVDFTTRCNMNCPVCFANTGATRTVEPAVADILARLPRAGCKNQPNVVIIGGEPTLRDDLPDLISGIATKGLIPRMSTNGLSLADYDYAAMLKKAGLNWIILQFDGVEDAPFIALRGRALFEIKKRIIENCERAGIAVQLAVMVDDKSNAGQLGRIIDFAFSQPAVKWVNLYPRSIVNHDEFADDEGLHVADMFTILEEQTNRQLTREDFISMMKSFSRLYSLTGNETFRQKLSTYPMVLFKTEKGMVPLSKLLTPLGPARHIEQTALILKNLSRFMNFQEMDIPGESLFLTMEKFHNRFAVDLCEASCCHMVFMTRDGFVPFDIYNGLYRDTITW